MIYFQKVKIIHVNIILINIVSLLMVIFLVNIEEVEYIQFLAIGNAFGLVVAVDIDASHF